MVHAIINNKGNNLLLDIPYKRTELYEQLASIGVWNPQGDVFVRDREDENISVKLYGDTEADNGLVSLFGEDDTLTRVNTVCDVLRGLSPEQREVIAQGLMQSKYHSPADMLVAMRDVKVERLNVDYYCPLTINIPDENDYELLEYGGSISRPTMNAIKAMLFDEQNRGDPMVEYFNEDAAIKEKLKSTVWDVTKKNGELYGVIHCRFKESLTPAEEETWKLWLSGQCSDGIGESAEQRPIQSEDGELYVSFWNDGAGSLMDDTEFSDYLSQNQNGGMQL